MLLNVISSKRVWLSCPAFSFVGYEGPFLRLPFHSLPEGDDDNEQRETLFRTIASFVFSQKVLEIKVYKVYKERLLLRLGGYD
jgi:hypothetical protein